MIFRDEMGEDCLYLNVWTPAKTPSERLPVMVWIHGGGFRAGSASEPRQDGERLAGQGVVVVGINYRLGVFGFLAHPDLTAESGRNASGNYAFMDQIAALRWVRDNVAGFGGDPGNVTIFGESAGSFAVSSLMASPPARGLFHRVIGESGAPFSLGRPREATLAEAEKSGKTLAAALGAGSLAALRNVPTQQVLDASLADESLRLGPSVDGYVLPEPVAVVFAAGRQSAVPLLAGWNEDEIRAGVVLGADKPTAETFKKQLHERFGEDAAAMLKVYPASTDAEALESAAALANDSFIGYGTWKWIESHSLEGDVPVYRYSFDRDVPVAPGTMRNGVVATAQDIGARHAGEIEYVFGAFDSLPDVPWEDVDREISDLMMAYWANFARAADPNAKGLPRWPRYDAEGHQVMHLGEKTLAESDALRPRYLALDAVAAAAASQEIPEP
jgi:para-nitrobenzyl esterase